MSNTVNSRAKRPFIAGSVAISLLLAFLMIGLGACNNGNTDGTTSQAQSQGNPPPPPPPPGTAAVAVTSGTSFVSSPVRISFAIFNFTIGLPGTPHLRFSIDNGAQHDFFNGSGINSDNGVLLGGAHTHFVHWTSTNSFDLFALPAGNHQVRLALVDGSNNEVSGASTIHTFNVQQPPAGDLQLQSVLGGLSFPVGLALAPDGRVFYNERVTGNVRIIDAGWTLNPTVFCSVSVQVAGEQGLLGLAVDPAFSSSNEVVYVYYTALGSANRVSRLSKSGGVCSETIILNNLPTSGIHNGGIIQFGPDGKLYIVIGDAASPSDAQNIDSLAGKVLRVNTDGSAPADNPFFVGSGGNRDKVYSYGHRNSFGMTFHPSTGHLWESENGPTSDDEVNRIVAGSNYGWPTVIGFGGGFVNPLLVFNPSVAPTGIIAIPAGSPVYPSFFHNNLLVADFIGGRIHRIVLGGGSLDLLTSSNVAFNGGLGGLLSFVRGSDGYIYVSSMNAIYRVVPH